VCIIYIKILNLKKKNQTVLLMSGSATTSYEVRRLIAADSLSVSTRRQSTSVRARSHVHCVKS